MTVKHRDHLIPASRGGSDDVENCVVVCPPCNLSKGDKTPSEWRPTGLPSWIYEKEKALASKYRMPARRKRQELRILGFDLLSGKMPVCLNGSCRLLAEWEIFSDTWAAYCARCAQRVRVRRELDEARSALHVLVQMRDGTLNRDASISALARAAGVSLEEYLDLAAKAVAGDSALHTRLKETFPWLSMWTPSHSGPP